MHLTHYVIIRSDVPAGIAAAMLVHAAGESVDATVPKGTHAIVLAARDEMHLLMIAAELQLAEIPHAPIFEPDEPWRGALMAIGLRPCERRSVRPLLKALPLYDPETCPRL